MKKFSILLAVSVLLISSMACKALNNLSGGGGDVPPADNGGDNPTNVDPQPPVDNGGGNVTLGDSPFPAASDAFNVVSTSETLTYQSKLSGDDLAKFYRDEFGKMGYSEDATMAVSFAGAYTLGFDGHESGRKIVIAIAPFGDGSNVVTIALQ